MNRLNLHQLFNVKWITPLLFVIFLLPSSGWAQEARPVAEDPEVEKRLMTLSEDLRCLVCQNETIAESRADFSNDMRREIREQIHANKTDAEIIEFLVARYGDFVLYDPPFKPTTFLLWFGPLILFLLGLGMLIVYLRQRRKLVDEEKPLSEVERKQAEALLNENKGNDS